MILHQRITVDDINGVNADRRRYAKLNGQIATGGGDGRRAVEAWSATGMSSSARAPGAMTHMTTNRRPPETLLRERYTTPEAKYCGTHVPNRVERIEKNLRLLGLMK